MGRIRVFRYLPEVDAFDVTLEYGELAQLLGLEEWSPVVWIGRLFTLDNDVGEHWFDNWDAREDRRARAEALGLDANRLLVIDPARFQDGRDGPCNSPEIRARFWHDVLISLELSTELIFAKARSNNEELRCLGEADARFMAEWIDDLEARISGWCLAHAEASPIP